jgi:hypothetical protein
LAWYEQPTEAAARWSEHPIAEIIGPMSLDVADADSDGDPDVIAGEHSTRDPETARLFLFENVDGQGSEWEQQLIYEGDEHHVGTQAVDIDNDGDLDIISIGWTHGRVLLYEQRAAASQSQMMHSSADLEHQTFLSIIATCAS